MTAAMTEPGSTRSPAGTSSPSSSDNGSAASHGSSPGATSAASTRPSTAMASATGSGASAALSTAARTAGSASTVRGVASTAPSRSRTSEAASGCTIRRPRASRPGGSAVAGQQQTAGAADQSTVGQRHGQRAEGVALADRHPAGQRGVEPAPPGRVATQLGQLVHDVGEGEPGRPQPVESAVVRRPGRAARRPAPRGARRPRRLRRWPARRAAAAAPPSAVASSGAAAIASTMPRRRAASRAPTGAGPGTSDSGSSAAAASSAYAPAASVDQEVGQRTRGHVPPRRVERERRDEQTREVERLVGRRRRVQRRRNGLSGEWPGPEHRPLRQVALLDRAVREQPRIGAPGPAYDLPAVVAGEHRLGAGHLHDDLGQPRQREQERVVDLGEQPAGEVGGGRVAQGQHHRGVEPGLGRAVVGVRQPEQRDVATAARELVGEGRYGEDCRLRVGERPAHATGRRGDPRLVGDSEHGGEPDAEAPDGLVVTVITFGRCPQRRERLDAGRVERRAGVRGRQRAVAAVAASSRPGTPARRAASAAFWASSTTTRSR